MPGEALVERVRAFARPLLPDGCDVLVAVSGGGDSVALLHLLLALRRPLGLGRVDVAHVNHGLRAAESAADEAFVRELAARAGATCRVCAIGGRHLGDAGVEAWARAGRYEALLRFAREGAYGRVVTGHTADDQAETLLMRLARGSGLAGLAGVRALRDDGVARPLLCARRDELHAWLARRGIAWRADSTNADLRYRRNRIRHEQLPRLEAEAPGIVSRFAETALCLQALLDELKPLINKWIHENVVQESARGFLLKSAGFAQEWIASEALAALLRQRGIAPSSYHVRHVAALAGRRGAAALLPGGWRCTGRGALLEFSRKSVTHI